MNHLGPGSIAVDPLARARDLGPTITAAADEIEQTQAIPQFDSRSNP